MVERETKTQSNLIDYQRDQLGFLQILIAFLVGGAAGFFVVFLFYRITVLALILGVLAGVVNIFVARDTSKKKRLMRLRIQFYDMLEALSVAMRAGNPPSEALKSAREDLALIYPQNADIMMELNRIIGGFQNGITLPVLFRDFADRSRLEDVRSFASVYETIEGKSNRVNEIVKETQQIIADKMEIEMEIDTLMTAAKSEVKIMMFMPILVLGLISNSGAGFMDSLYTTPTGRIVSTVGLVVFVFCLFLARKFSEVEL